MRLAILAIVMTLASAPAFADDDLTPKLIKPAERDPRHAEEIQHNIDALKDLFEKIEKATGGKVNPNTPIDIGELKNYGLNNPGVNIVGALQTALNLMEAYGVIDPRENFIQPDLNPPGMPPLASRAVGDPNLTPEEYGAFRTMLGDIDRAKNFLEKNYVVLKQTEIKTKRLSDLANSAANMNGIAGLYWAKIQGDPSDPMNKSKAAFYAKYDGAQANGLKFLNDQLKAMGEFEYKKYGDRNWYLYFGLPYYNFMSARYTRA
jgi:hypothetical protein